MRFQLFVEVVLLVIMLIITGPTHGKNISCKCTDLIPRDFVTFGACGQCARCWWDLYFYSNTFQDVDSSLVPGIANLAKAKSCAENLPFPITFDEDVQCAAWLEECHNETDTMFKTQCHTIYGPGNVEELKEPTPNITDWDENKALKEWKVPPKFTGKDSNFYPRTCPIFFRHYHFTYYLLFDGAFKKYNKTSVVWNENTAVAAVAPLTNKEARDNAATELKSNFFRFGVDMNKRRFCDNADVFVCVQ